VHLKSDVAMLLFPVLFRVTDHQFLLPTFLLFPCINLHFSACHCSELCHPTLAALSWFVCFLFPTENFIRNKELEKILNLPCSVPLLLEREVIIRCNSLNFLFLKHLFFFKLLIQFGVIKWGERKVISCIAKIQIGFDFMIQKILFLIFLIVLIISS